MNYEDRCRQIVARASASMLTADQTLLNVCLEGDTTLLPDDFNRRLAPCSSPAELGGPLRAIWHFVGSPKPWDAFGEFVHGSYVSYQPFLRQTAFNGYRSYLHWNPSRIRRTLSIARCYYTQLRLKRLLRRNGEGQRSRSN